MNNFEKSKVASNNLVNIFKYSKDFFGRGLSFFGNLKFWIIFVCILFGPFWTVNLTTFSINTNFRILEKNQVKTLLVLGAKVNGEIPSLVLAQRLNQAFGLFQNGQFDKILLSGGQREPIVMKNYLQKLGVPAENLFEDWGGLRTIDSCWRAKNIFKISKVAIITQSFHLPRSVAICQSLGIETFPIVASNSIFSTVTYGIFREVFACWDSFLDLLKGYQAAIQSDGMEPDLSD